MSGSRIDVSPDRPATADKSGYEALNWRPLGRRAMKNAPLLPADDPVISEKELATGRAILRTRPRRARLTRKERRRIGGFYRSRQRY